jgi:hypothetical protein
MSCMQQKLLAKSTIWKKIRRLDLPKETKKKLRDLWHEAKALVQAIVEWLYKRRELCATVMLGVAVAYLVHPLPVLGPILGTLSIALSVLYGIGLQFKADLDRHFRFVIEGKRV